MDKKIIAIMVSLLVIAAVVVSVVMYVSGGGLGRGGGFTDLFNDLTYNGNQTYGQTLSLPDDWHVNDKKKVSDVIVDMAYRKQTIGQTSVYITTLWFVYLGNEWTTPYQPYGPHGSLFYVPDTSHDGYFEVDNNMFSIEVSSATNLSAEYKIGDVISVESTLVTNTYSMLAFGEWTVSGTI